MNGLGRQVLELAPCSLREVDGKELDDEVVTFYPRHATREVVILQRHARV
jgi:hypothetical protein